MVHVWEYTRDCVGEYTRVGMCGWLTAVVHECRCVVSSCVASSSTLPPVGSSSVR